MAAQSTVPQLPSCRKSPMNKSGVLTLSGFGVRVRVRNAHLELEDGVGMERRTLRLPRVNNGLKRLVCISEDGFATFGALKWLAEVGVPFLMLDRMGRVLFVTGPTASSEVRLRRAQALALGNGVGLEICRRLIDAKLEGQERVIREQVNDPATADVIAIFRVRLATADSVEAVRLLEAHAALAYFGAWHGISVLWPKADLRKIPDHWRTVGSRHSPLSGGPRLAVTPVHAILNYCFALVQSESRSAVCALGLDAGLGVGLHTDTANRDSLALDVLEPVRPQVESWVLRWIATEPLRRADFYETTTGNCRLMSHLCAKLSESAPVWGKLVAPWAEFVARTLWERASGSSNRSLPTHLTQQHRREAKGQPSFPTVQAPRPERLCRGCGKMISNGRTHCAACAVTVATDRLIEVAHAGRMASRTAEAEARRSETQRRQATARYAWRVGPTAIAY
jgi:CRISPR-associated endonuclease Cas1